MISNLGCNASFLFPFISDYGDPPLAKEITNLRCFSASGVVQIWSKKYLWGWVLVAFGDGGGHPEQVWAQLPIPTIDLKRCRITSVNKTQTSGKHIAAPQQGCDKCKSVRAERWCTKQSYLHLCYWGIFAKNLIHASNEPLNSSLGVIASRSKSLQETLMVSIINLEQQWGISM